MICFLAAGLLSTELQAQGTYEQGASDVSLGRFGTWPYSGSVFAYEEDIVKRVCADHILRDHKDLTQKWTLYFGVTDDMHPVENIPPFSGTPIEDDTIWPEEQNWVYKKYAVLRDNAPIGGLPTAPNYLNIGHGYTYTVSVNSTSPGTRIQSVKDRFYLENTGHGFGYVAYQFQLPNGKSKSKILGDFADPAAPTVVIDGQDLYENWILLFDSDNASFCPYSTQIPVLVSFSHRPVNIECADDYIKLNFDPDPHGNFISVFLSLPFGSAAVDKATASNWRGVLPKDVVERCRLINRIANNWPVDVDETFSFEDISGQVPRVFVRNQFSYSYMGGAWESNGYVSNTPYVLMPPVVGLAQQEGLDVTTSSAVDIEFPTKYGPLLMVDLVSTAEFEIPGAPVHDVHLVGTTGETIWKQRVNRMINLSALETGKFEWTVALLGGLCNRGEAATLAMTRDWARDHYISYMKNTIEKRLFDYGGSHTVCSEEHPWDYNYGWEEMTWENIPLPPEGVWPPFWAHTYLLPDPIYSTHIPHDIDASAAIVLIFLYEYGLWSGDWALLDDHWQAGSNVPGIPDIYFPLELLQDWAYMAASHELWGGGGSQMDMFNAQIEGYSAFAKIAEILGHDEEARRARYLAAKAQIPFALRWVAKDYIGQHYKLLDDFTEENQVISGFSEWEPSGPVKMLALDTGVRGFFTMDEWADWTISGQTIHPLNYDILRTLLDESIPGEMPFRDVLADCRYEMEASDLLNTSGEPKTGTFAESKLFGFFKWRDLLPMNKTDLISWIDTLYMDFEGDPSSGSIKGARYQYPLYMIDNSFWYSKTLGDHYYRDPVKFFPFPLMAAIAEAHGVPVRIGAWAPAKLKSATFDPQNDKFIAEFEMDQQTGLPDPVVRLQVNHQTSPPVVTLGNYGTPTYDPLWKVWEIPLYGYGEWKVELDIEKEIGSSWTTIGSNSNLISDPGFEESGFERTNIEIGWRPVDNFDADADWVFTSTDDFYTGDQSARLEVQQENQVASLWQYLWIGEGHSFDLGFWYKIMSNDLVLQVSVFKYADDVGCLDPLETDIWYFTCPPCPCTRCANCTGGDCTGEWQHFTATCNMNSAAKLKLEFAIRDRWSVEDEAQYPWVPGNEHKVYLDDVSILCSALDTGSGKGKGFEDPDISLTSASGPLLSEVSSQPNPFNPSTVISFKLGRSKHVSLKIYDLAGRLVRTLVNDELKSGPHQITWDGKTNKGMPSASGIYFFRLSVAHKIVTGKLVLIK
jgi:hypothetical protein